MITPLFGLRRNYLLYGGTWIIIAAVHFAILWFYRISGIETAIVESLLANAIIAIMGLGIWYPTYYLFRKRSHPITMVVQQILMSVFASAVWMGITYLALSSIFADNLTYRQYLFSSIPWRLATGMLYYFLIIMLFILLITYQQFIEKIKSENELKALVKETQLNSLKSQINPHFLFNSLNSISSLTLSSPEKARDMIIRLSEFMRYSLSKKEQSLTTLRQEIENISRYLDIERVRFGQKLKVEQKVPEQCLDYKLPWLILQPLIENSVKFGVYENTGAAVIRVAAQCDAAKLRISLSNNFDHELIVNKGEGIGLQNIRHRLRLIYGSDNLMYVNEADGIFEVTLLFPQKIAD